MRTHTGPPHSNHSCLSLQARAERSQKLRLPHAPGHSTIRIPQNSQKSMWPSGAGDARHSHALEFLLYESMLYIKIYNMK